MPIQIKRWDGQGDFEDPKTGELLHAAPESIYGLVAGRVVSGIGGVSTGTEAVQINFRDGSAVWFITAGGQPRILLRSAPK